MSESLPFWEFEVFSLSYHYTCQETLPDYPPIGLKFSKDGRKLTYRIIERRKGKLGVMPIINEEIDLEPFLEK